MICLIGAGRRLFRRNFKVHTMPKNTKCFAALCFSLATLLGYAAPSNAQQNQVTAIDIALAPDATMVRHAKSANERLLRVYPKGFALDATHHAHITMLQQFVRTADLDKVYAAAKRFWPMRSRQAGN